MDVHDVDLVVGEQLRHMRPGARMDGQGPGNAGGDPVDRDAVDELPAGEDLPGTRGGRDDPHVVTGGMLLQREGADLRLDPTGARERAVAHMGDPHHLTVRHRHARECAGAGPQDDRVRPRPPRR
jgi:hypothetical protein